MNKSSILVVEDETIVAMDIEERLTRMGYSVTGLSSSGREAIALAEAHRPDLILMDIHLKGSMDGIVAADEIRRRFHLPVIFLTAYSEEKTLERAKLAEPFGYILKPFKETDLKSTIEIALFKHRSETKLYRMNRLLDTMTRVGQTVMRSGSRKALFPAVCRVLVEHGGIDLAWIGWFDSEKSRLEPLAHYGNGDESLLPIELDAEDRPGGPSQLGQAFQDGQPFIDNAFSQNLCSCFHRHPVFYKRFQTAAIFPILLEGQVYGALNLCVDEPGFWGQQEIDAFMKVTSDISFALENIKTEAALRESERRYRMVADYTYDWEYWIQPDGSFIYISPSCERITGYAASEFIHNPALMKTIVHPDDRSWFESRIVECLQKGGSVCQQDYRIVTRDGKVRWLNHNCQPIRNEDGANLGIRASNRDISDRVKAMEEKEKMEERLRQTQKMEAIGNLAGGIAHDFNNILSPIIGYTEMSLDEISQDSPIRDNLEQILEATGRAKDLVRQILSFSRGDKEQPMIPIDAGRIVKEALGLLRASLPSSIEITQHIEKIQILADATQLHQVIVNLCTNASHAMEGKGTLDVSLSIEILSDHDIESLALMALKPGKHLRLRVSDTGKGMTAETMSHIFEPYYTTKAMGKGTGLGLAVVHGIVQRHNGGIWVQSEPGKGSIFDIYIPAAEGELTAEKKTKHIPPPGGSERILFIDDEPKIAEISARMLKKLGYRVTAFTHPQEALKAFQARPSEFDLVITDHTMPVMTGADLIGEIRHIRHDIPAIICTGYSEIMTEDAVRRMGIQKLAMKPLDRKHLADLVRNVLDETILSPLILTEGTKNGRK